MMSRRERENHDTNLNVHGGYESDPGVELDLQIQWKGSNDAGSDI